MIAAEIIELFDSGARMTWNRLYFGEGLRIRQGEVTLTDTLLLHLKAGLRRWPGAFEIVKTTGAEEAHTGADLELWVGSDLLGWLPFLIQAKRIDYSRGTYPTLNHRVSGSGRSQFEILGEYARRHDLLPLYWLYNARPGSALKRPRGWIGDMRSWGCSAAPLSVIAVARASKGSRSFDWIHANPNVIPLRCMLCTLSSWAAVAATERGQCLTKIKAAFGFEPKIRPELPRDLLRVPDAARDEQWNQEMSVGPNRRFSRYTALLDLSKTGAQDA